MVIIAAQEDGPEIGRIGMRRIPGAAAENLLAFVKDVIELGSTLQTDGWVGYLPRTAAGYNHEITFLKGSLPIAVNSFTA